MLYVMICVPLSLLPPSTFICFLPSAVLMLYERQSGFIKWLSNRLLESTIPDVHNLPTDASIQRRAELSCQLPGICKHRRQRRETGMGVTGLPFEAR